MMRNYSALHEPELYFGGDRACIDPQIGMLKFGPHGGVGRDPPPARRIIAGALGTDRSMNAFKAWLEFLGHRISDEKRPGSRYVHLDFPGLSLDGPLRFSIHVSPTAVETLDSKVVKSIENERARRRRVRALAAEYVRLLDILKEADPKPEVVFLPLDETLLRVCKDPFLKADRIRYQTRSFGKKKADEEDEEEPAQDGAEDEDDDETLFDFHNYLKAQAAIRDFRTQILLPGTLTFASDRQSPAVIGWNIAVGVYYKATGNPWKLADIDDRTCFIGISFFQDTKRGGGVMRASIAQVYMRTGESQVIRGDGFRWDPYASGRQVHLDRDRMAKLVSSGVQLYRDTHGGKNPDRVVIHKPTAFYEEELQGCEDGAKGCASLDVVYINPFNNFRAYHEGEQYPVVRGTLISEGNEAMLYTTGFVPALGTFLGAGSPAPLRLIAQRMDSSITQVATDILGLTKLDWNSSAFASRLPVTLSVAKKVGAVMAELSAVTPTPPTSYKYYM